MILGLAVAPITLQNMFYSGSCFDLTTSLHSNLMVLVRQNIFQHLNSLNIIMIFLRTIICICIWCYYH